MVTVLDVFLSLIDSLLPSDLRCGIQRCWNQRTLGCVGWRQPASTQTQHSPSDKPADLSSGPPTLEQQCPTLAQFRSARRGAFHPDFRTAPDSGSVFPRLFALAILPTGLASLQYSIPARSGFPALTEQGRLRGKQQKESASIDLYAPCKRAPNYPPERIEPLRK